MLPLFVFLLRTSASRSEAPPFGKLTCQLIGIINSPPPCPHQQKDTQYRSLLLCLERSMRKGGAEAADFTGAQSFLCDSCGERGRCRRRRRVTAGAAVHIRPSDLRRQSPYTPVMHKMQKPVIYPGVPKRRIMFICYRYFSSIVIR